MFERFKKVEVTFCALMGRREQTDTAPPIKDFTFWLEWKMPRNNFRTWKKNNGQK